MMEQFEIMDTDMLACAEGGFGGWGYMLSALLGGLALSPTLNQLNGKFAMILLTI